MTATEAQTETGESTNQDAKQRLHAAIDALPVDALAEVASFLEYQQYKHGQERGTTPYKPVALGGLWRGIRITEEDFEGAREDMLSRTRKRSKKA